MEKILLNQERPMDHARPPCDSCGQPKSPLEKIPGAPFLILLVTGRLLDYPYSETQNRYCFASENSATRHLVFPSCGVYEVVVPMAQSLTSRSPRRNRASTSRPSDRCGHVGKKRQKRETNFIDDRSGALWRDLRITLPAASRRAWSTP